MWGLPDLIQSHFNVEKKRIHNAHSILMDLFVLGFFGGWFWFFFLVCFFCLFVVVFFGFWWVVFSGFLISFSFYGELAFNFQITFLGQACQQTAKLVSLCSGKSLRWLLPWLTTTLQRILLPYRATKHGDRRWTKDCLVLQGSFPWGADKRRKNISGLSFASTATSWLCDLGQVTSSFYIWVFTSKMRVWDKIMQ